MEDVISEMEKEPREAGNASWRLMLEWRIKAKEQRETDVVGSDTAHMLTSGSQSSKAEIGVSDVSRVVVDWWGTLEDQKFLSSTEIPQNRGTK